MAKKKLEEAVAVADAPEVHNMPLHMQAGPQRLAPPFPPLGLAQRQPCVLASCTNGIPSAFPRHGRLGGPLHSVPWTGAARRCRPAGAGGLRTLPLTQLFPALPLRPPRRPSRL